jgi:hypothetical protein
LLQLQTSQSEKAEKMPQTKILTMFHRSPVLDSSQYRGELRLKVQRQNERCLWKVVDVTVVKMHNVSNITYGQFLFSLHAQKKILLESVDNSLRCAKSLTQLCEESQYAKVYEAHADSIDKTMIESFNLMRRDYRSIFNYKPEEGFVFGEHPASASYDQIPKLPLYRQHQEVLADHQYKADSMQENAQILEEVMETLPVNFRLHLSPLGKWERVDDKSAKPIPGITKFWHDELAAEQLRASRLRPAKGYGKDQDLPGYQVMHLKPPLPKGS